MGQIGSPASYLVRTDPSLGAIKCSNLQETNTFFRFLSLCSIGRIYFHTMWWRTNYTSGLILGKTRFVSFLRPLSVPMYAYTGITHPLKVQITSTHLKYVDFDVTLTLTLSYLNCTKRCPIHFKWY